MFYILDQAPRRILAAIAVICFLMIGFGAYLQYVVGLEPCPMCIVQRYALIVVGIFTAIASLCQRQAARLIWVGLALLTAGFGAFTAARQTWLQWYPPEMASCGRDFYGMIESFPLSRAIPMIFKGSGDCSAVDWTFLGGSIANWSLLCFVGFGLLFLIMILRAACNCKKTRN